MGGWAFWLAGAAGALAVLGLACIVAQTLLVHQFARRLRVPPLQVLPRPTTILKPLYGDEPYLAANLASFRDQYWGAPVQIITGIHTPDDRAAIAATALGEDVELVVDTRRHGANAKIGNLINMAGSARHDIIILSDSDIAVPPDYLARVIAVLDEPGVGAVTCAYTGRGDNGFWSTLGAAMLSYHFLPGVLMSLALRTGDVCMGSTIAMRRDTLDRIGGFERFADILADDHAIGVAVRELGLRVEVAPVLVTHASAEKSFGALIRHELRWAATVRDLNPAGYAGLVITHPLPFALLAAVLAPGWPAAMLVAGAIGARVVAASAIDQMAGRTTAPWWLMPVRDLMSFGVFVGSFFVRQVEWRDTRLAMREAGRIEIKRA